MIDVWIVMTVQSGGLPVSFFWQAVALGCHCLQICYWCWSGLASFSSLHAQFLSLAVRKAGTGREVTTVVCRHIYSAGGNWINSGPTLPAPPDLSQVIICSHKGGCIILPGTDIVYSSHDRDLALLLYIALISRPSKLLSLCSKFSCPCSYFYVHCIAHSWLSLSTPCALYCP